MAAKFTTEIKFFQTPSGKEPVREHLRENRGEISKAVGDALQAVQWAGLSASFQGLSVKQISGRPGLWEFRIDQGTQVHQRVFFCFQEGAIWLLHAIDKNSGKTPVRDLDLAEARRDELLARAKKER